ncbi:MAG: fatty acid desaturase [Rhodobacter sp.]|nr:fatty acid desaturase [Rhodobacter sp.]
MRRVLSEWPTLALLAICYAAWGVGTTAAAALWLPLGIAVTTLAIALFASLQHEMIHGHPFKNAAANAALVFPGLTLFIPYGRFRDTHLDHHQDARLTDPYDDPETNYLDPAVWHRLPRAVRAVLRFNNTLLGRLTVGTAVSLVTVAVADLRAARTGDARVLRGWLWHIPALVPVIAWLATAAQMPLWAYILSAYAGLSLIKIRTFLEHQAHDRASGRTVIIEDRGPLAWLFLNNNLHVVHHMHPRVAWYRLPRLYADNKERFLERNGGYVYRSYAEIFRRYLFRRKDPVPHPFWP